MKIKSLLLTLFVWANLLAVLFFAWKWWVRPWMKERDILSTSSGSKYETKIRIRHDSFSGYAVLRSAKMRELMGANKVGLVFKDDGADYPGRLKALQNGECDLAVFTIDAYLQSGAQAGEFPGSIIAVIDETKGADAIVAFKQAVPDIRALNKKDARFLLTEGSPSEFLARVVVSNFMLPDLPKQWITGKAGAKDVFAAMKFSDRKSPQAFVLWEPYVSRALQIDGVHKVLGTEKLQGYILDVIVASREFLRKDEALAVKTLEAYFRALYHYGNRSEGMRELLAEDAKEYGEAIDPAQAAAIEEGIQFKNTAANWQHFGLAQAGKGMYLEDVIDNIGRVLTQTGSISANLVEGKAGSIFYDAPLKALQAKGFHPGRLDDGPLTTGGPGDASSLPEERAAASAELPAIDDDEAAKRLRVVGDIRLAPIMFARGRAEINVFSTRELDQLSRRLINFPGYYLRIQGHFRLAGDAAANRALARERARAVTQRLVSQGIPAARLVTSEDASDLLGSEGQSVSFSFLERPF